MTQKPPVPPPFSTTTTHPTATTPVVHVNTFSVFSIFTDPLFYDMLIAIAVSVVMIVIARIIAKNRRKDLFVNMRNADAVFLLYHQKTNKAIVVPAKFIGNGLFIATYNGEVYYIAVSADISPIMLENINKPFYFAVGVSTTYLTVKLENINEVALINTFSDKSMSELLANLMDGVSQITGKIPIANRYYLSIAVNMNDALRDDVISFMVSSADSIVNAITSTSKEVTELQKIELQREKLRAFASSAKMRIMISLIIALPIVAVLAYVIYNLFVVK